jgi:hypothetical protein
MSISTTPVPARTDAASATTARPTAATSLVRRAGLGVTAGSLAWAVPVAVLGTTPAAGTWQATVVNVGAFLFQLGLAGLVTVVLRTGAIGTGRLARGLLHLEHVLLGVAMFSSLLWAFAPSLYDTGFFLVTDLFWPISMLGMAAIGIRIGIAGRWRGVARVWPAIAESWAPVVVPTSFLLPALTQYIGAAHLLVGYVVLGLILARRPELTGARD